VFIDISCIAPSFLPYYSHVLSLCSCITSLFHYFVGFFAINNHLYFMDNVNEGCPEKNEIKFAKQGLRLAEAQRPLFSFLPPMQT